MIFFLTATLYRLIIISVGVLYPAFNSYKSLNRRDGYEQVKWIMYWIVFAAFSACEVVTDMLFSWFPLYNEAKILFVLWMVLPMTRGSSYLYRKIIHPNLLKHELEIDRYIASASNKGCEVLLEFGQHGMNFAANAVIKTADHLKRSYSVGDVSAPSANPSRNVMNLERTQSQTSLDSTPSLESIVNLPLQDRAGQRPTRSAKKSKQGGENKPTATTGQVSHRGKKALRKVDEEF